MASKPPKKPPPKGRCRGNGTAVEVEPSAVVRTAGMRDEMLERVQKAKDLPKAAVFKADAGHVSEIFPGIEDDSLLQEVVWHHFAFLRDFDVTFLTPDGKWRISRDPLNTRGEASTMLPRKVSCEEVGVIQNLRMGGWLFPHAADNVVTLATCFTAMHWASLNDGLRLAWESDKDKLNPLVQNSVAAGMRHSTVFYNETLPAVKMWMKDFGNKSNLDASGLTFTDVYRCIPGFQAAWERKKKDQTWNHNTCTQAQLEEKKFSLAQVLYPGRFRSSRMLTDCVGAQSKMATHKISQLQVDMVRNLFKGKGIQQVDADGGLSVQKLTFEAMFFEWCKRYVDYTHASINNHRTIVTSVSNIYNRCKDDVGLCFKLFAMCLPLCGAPLGACGVLRKGLPQPAIPAMSEEMVSRLFAPMKDTVTALHISKESKEAQSQSAGSAGALAVATVSTEMQVGDKFYDHLQKELQYLLRIDPHLDRLLDFEALALYGCMKDGVPLDEKSGKQIVTKKNSALRKKMKSSIYVVRQLKPRDSDADFPDGVLMEEDVQEISEEEAHLRRISNAPIGEVLAELHSELQLAHLSEALYAQDFSTPILQVPEVAKASSELMMLGILQAAQVVCPSDLELMRYAFSEASKLVSRILPSAFFDFLVKVQAYKDNNASWKDSIQDPGEFDKLGHSWMKAFDAISLIKLERDRVVLWAHLLFEFGKIPFAWRKLDGSVQITANLPSFVQSHLALLKNCDGGFVESFLDTRQQAKESMLSVDSFVDEYTKLLQTAMQEFVDLDITSHAQAVTKYAKELEASSAEDLRAACEKGGVSGDAGSDARPQVIAKLLEQFIESDPPKKNALALFNEVNGVEHNNMALMERLRALTRKEVEGAQANHPEQGQVVGADEDASDDDAVVELSLKSWRTSAIEQELAEDLPFGLTRVTLRLLFSSLQLAFDGVAIKFIQGEWPGNQGEALLHFQFPRDEEEDSNAKKSKMTLVQSKSGSVSLPFWGKVFDDVSGQLLARQRTLPFDVIEVITKEKLTCFLDGSMVMKRSRSDCCPAWFVPPVPADQTEKEKSQTPKKRRVAAAPVFKSTLKATHEICYSRSTNNLTVGMKDFAFQLPSLVSIPGLPHGIWPCVVVRKRIEHDDKESAKAEKKAKPISAFAAG